MNFSMEFHPNMDIGQKYVSTVHMECWVVDKNGGRVSFIIFENYEYVCGYIAVARARTSFVVKPNSVPSNIRSKLWNKWERVAQQIGNVRFLPSRFWEEKNIKY